MADKKTLHFFPEMKRMVWVVNGKIAIDVEAWGGEPPDPKNPDPIMKPRRTTPGRYVIDTVIPYRTDTWPWSKIAWGTALQIDTTSGEVRYATGLARRPWELVSKRIPGLRKEDIQSRYEALYGAAGRSDDIGDRIPSTWVFNDFGVKAIRYYVDKNKNRRRDKGENLSGEMIHTTPENEAQEALGQTVSLAPSHGCIHVVPSDRTRLEKAGAFARGTDLRIHPYSVTKIPANIQ